MTKKGLRMIIAINSIVDSGATISLEEMEDLIENENVIQFLKENFPTESQFITSDYEEQLEICKNLKEYVNLFEKSTARRKYGIENNGYLMLSSALIEVYI